jgi:hypothetical protein
MNGKEGRKERKGKETKGNERKGNETKRNERKRNETKGNERRKEGRTDGMKEGRKEGTEAEGNSTPSPYVSLSPSVLLIADFVKALPLTPKMSDDIRSIGPGDESLPPGPSTRRASELSPCFTGLCIASLPLAPVF